MYFRLDKVNQEGSLGIDLIGKGSSWEKELTCKGFSWDRELMCKGSASDKNQNLRINITPKLIAKSKYGLVRKKRIKWKSLSFIKKKENVDDEEWAVLHAPEISS